MRFLLSFGQLRLEIVFCSKRFFFLNCVKHSDPQQGRGNLTEMSLKDFKKLFPCDLVIFFWAGILPSLSKIQINDSVQGFGKGYGNRVKLIEINRS